MKIFINLYCFCSILLFSTMSFAFSGGTGTKEDPYLLRTCPELQSMISFPSAHFQLADNINCSGFDYGDGGGFMPVGSQAYPFIGVLDGNDFTISYLNIYRPTKDNIGLIGYMSSFQNTSGVLKNIKISDSNVTGRDYVGGIVGYSGGGGSTEVLADSHYYGDVTGEEFVGGLLGSSNVTISNSHVNANITADGDNAGGLAGYTNQNISNSWATGTVKSTYAESEAIGGLAGRFLGDLVEKSFADSIVTGYTAVGGLFGQISYAEITDSYALGEVHGDHHVGGLIGRTNGTEIITNSFAAAKVTGAIYAGGLIGYKYSGSIQVNNSYWDTVVSGQPFSAGGTPKTTTEMYQQATYTNWNFNNIWMINEGVNYPHLR